MLTERQAEIAGLVARGWTNQRIAAETGLSVSTVGAHITSAAARLAGEGKPKHRIMLWYYGRGAGLQEASPTNLVKRQRRRSRLREATGDGVSVAQWEQILADSLGLCAYCNERRPLTMDHITALSCRGAHDIENLAAACRPCNSSKNDHALLVWLALR